MNKVIVLLYQRLSIEKRKRDSNNINIMLSTILDLCFDTT